MYSKLSKTLTIAMAAMPGAAELRFLWKSTDTGTSGHGLVPSSPGISRSNLDIAASNLDQILESQSPLAKTGSNQPTCQVIATAALRHDCSAFNRVDLSGSSAPADQVISDSLMIYGARLAVCELREASAQIPDACRAFIPTEQTTKKRAMAGHVTDEDFGAWTELFPSYDEVTAKDTKRCVEALFPKDQSWVSYSNSKQNALEMCGALQGVVHNQATLEKVRDIVRLSAGLSEQLQKDRAAHHDFMQDVQDHSVEQMRQYEHERKKSQDEFDASIAHSMAKFETGLREVIARHAHSMQTDLDLVNTATSDISSFLATHKAEAHNALEVLEYITTMMEQELAQKLGEIRLDAESAHETILSSTENLTHLSNAIDDNTIKAEGVTSGLSLAAGRVQAVNDGINGLNQNMQVLKDNLGPVHKLLNVASHYMVRVMIWAIFVIVLGLWGFAILLHFRDFPLAAIIFALTGTILALATILAAYIDPSNLFQPAATDVFQDDLIAWNSFCLGIMVSCIGIGSLLLLVIFTRPYFVKKPQGSLPLY